MGMVKCWAIVILLNLGALHAGPGRMQIFPAPIPLTVINLTGDRDGLIWIATKQGVFRFDGLHYQQIPGYPFQSVRFIAAEPGGAVWAGGSQGLARYYDSKWAVILNEPVLDLAMSSAGLWANAVDYACLWAPKQNAAFPGQIPRVNC